MNKLLYDKLLLQAEEAKEQGMIKLAEAILQTIHQDDEDLSYKELNNNIYNDLWKVASKIINYYDANNIDIIKVDNIINIIAYKFIDEVEVVLEKDKTIKGPFEPKVLGEI
jgi:transposase